MAKAVTVIITGDKEVNRMLLQLSGTQGKAVIRKAARAGIKVVEPAAKRYAPVLTGAMRRAIKVRATKRSRKSVGVRITIGNENFKGKTFYGGFQEWGWLTGKRTKKSYVESAGPNESPKKGTRRHIPGKFFLQRAANSKRKSALAVYRAEIKRGVEDTVRRNAAKAAKV